MKHLTAHRRISAVVISMLSVAIVWSLMFVSVATAETEAEMLKISVSPTSTVGGTSSTNPVVYTLTAYIASGEPEYDHYIVNITDFETNPVPAGQCPYWGTFMTVVHESTLPESKTLTESRSITGTLYTQPGNYRVCANLYNPNLNQIGAIKEAVFTVTETYAESVVRAKEAAEKKAAEEAAVTKRNYLGPAGPACQVRA
jgi:uncharacterized protein YxeA